MTALATSPIHPAFLPALPWELVRPGPHRIEWGDESSAVRGWASFGSAAAAREAYDRRVAVQEIGQIVALYIDNVFESDAARIA